MSTETLLSETVVLSIPISWRPSRPQRAGELFSEGAKLAAMLRDLNDGNFDGSIVIADHEYEVTSLSRCDDRPDGGCRGQIEFALKEEPERTQRLAFTLARCRAKQTGTLTLSYNPTAMLAPRPGCAVTILNSGDTFSFPSSDNRVLEHAHKIGFEILGAVHRLWRRRSGSLFGRRTLAEIEDGHAKISSTQWRADLRLAGPEKFLQILPVFYGQLVIDDDKTFKLGAHLGLTVGYEPDPQTKVVNEVRIVKKHGTKPLFSIKFSIGRVDESTSRKPSEMAVPEYLRLAVTAHPEGVVRIASEARRKLRGLGKLKKEDWAQDFLAAAARASASDLQLAALVLSQDDEADELSGGSLADWLIPYVFKDVLALDALSSFTEGDLKKLRASDDEIVKTWSTGAFVGKNWAGRIAKKAGVSRQTVYNRQKEIVEEHHIDIAAPPKFYQDLLFFGTGSLTPLKDRSMFVSSMTSDDPATATKIWNRAFEDFTQRRMGISAIVDGDDLREFEVELVDPRVRAKPTARKPIPGSAERSATRRKLERTQKRQRPAGTSNGGAREAGARRADRRRGK